MANHLYATQDEFVTPVSVTAVSEAADREAENVLNWTRPNQLFVGSGAVASEALVFDFGSTTTLAGLFVDAVNVGTVTVEGNATNSWGSPSYSADFEGLASAPDWGRHRIFCDLASGTFASVGYRYMRLRPAALSDTHDGSSVWKVGGVLPLSLYYTFAENLGFPFDVEVFEPVDVQPRIGAPPEVSILGDKRFFVTLSQPLGTDALEADVKLILDQGAGRHVFFARNNGDAREAWVMRRVSRNALSTIGVRTRSIQNVLFEEVG